MRTFFIGLAVSVAVSASAFGQDMFTNVQTIAASGGERDTITFDSLSPDVMRMSPGDTINLNFGAGYVAELDEIRTQAMGGLVWAGRVEGQGLNGRVIITETNGHAFGRVSTPDGIWQIVSLDGDQQIVRTPNNSTWYRENDTVSIDPDMLPPHLSIAEMNDVVAEAVPVGSNGTIDIAIYYSQSFTALWGMAASGRVQHLMAVLDQALIDSDTGLRARLVYNNEVTLTNDNADQAQTLANISGIADPQEAPTITQDLSALRAVRQTHGADLVGVIQRAGTGHGGCGIANLLGNLQAGANAGDINASWAPQGFSVVGDWFDTANDGFCSDVTFAHEVGHNMGFAHNVEDSGVGTGVRTFSNGHRVDCEWMTIMSYPTNPQNPQSASTCPQGASRTIGNEQEIAYFSNPAINLCPGGAACGIAVPAGDGVDRPLMDNMDPADNARAAREESRDIVSFYPEVARVVSSVLPITRSVQNGTSATAFATVINPAAGGNTATQCGLRLGGSTPAQFSYQTTTAANVLTGAANTPVDIASGGSQNFVFSVTSATDFADNQGLQQASANNETNLFIEAFCTNRRSAEFFLGLNSLTFTSSATAVPDIVALAASGDPGRVNVPTAGNQVGAFAVAISNVGAAGTITASGDTGTRTLAIQNIEICQTNPTTGACLTGRAATAQVTIGANETATFAVFVRGNGQTIENDPARNRVFVRFNEGANARGATSVAVRTQ